MEEEIGFHPKSLCIDLETSVETEASIYKIAVWRADTKQSEVFKGKFRSAEVKPKLDALTVGASFLLGHNVVPLRQSSKSYCRPSNVHTLRGNFEICQ